MSGRARRKTLPMAVGLAVLVAALFVLATSDDWKSHTLAAESAFFDGNYVYAEKQFLAATAAAETFGSRDARLATALRNLASFYYFVGRYRDAEPLIKRAMTIEETVHGPGHPAVAAGLVDLVNVYAADSRLREARNAAELALEIHRRALGPSHPVVADNLDLYASVLEKSGRLEEAEQARTRARAIHMERLAVPAGN